MRQYEDENHAYRAKEASKDRSCRGKRTVHERGSDELEGLSAPNFERFRKRHFATFDDVVVSELSERNREREVARRNHQEKKMEGLYAQTKTAGNGFVLTTTWERKTAITVHAASPQNIWMVILRETGTRIVTHPCELSD